MKIKVQRDQAVWERETFTIEVGDDFDPENELHMAELEAKIDADRFDAPDYACGELVASVEGASVDTQITLPDGMEIQL